MHLNPYKNVFALQILSLNCLLCHTFLGNLDRIRDDQGWLAEGNFHGNLDRIRHEGRCYVAEGHPWGPKAPSSQSERARPAGA